TSDKHQSVDDTPYGGGSGMVMSLLPLTAACEHLDAEADTRNVPRAHRILLTPAGKRFEQADAERLAKLPAIMLLCGRYEGIDDRMRHQIHEELSLGDFVLNGGEVAALAIIEATARLLPGMIGNDASLKEESHGAGVLEYPQFTRPREFRGHEVPEVLLSGNHALIARWRRVQALVRTRERRPDLFAKLTLSKQERAWLDEHDAQQAKNADRGGKP
ncbi:MAG TPA: tRNA (guanosine(37)-N1)-methyltransferase TrmD, partial [Polyangiales bacterium]|nr:tRNA (guanosine(37)-N1)-methyltransferase TrmD [Polyangiales bacterium]